MAVTGLFTTIVDLAKLGNLGIGLAIILMGFVLTIQAKPVDTDTAKLRGNFLKFGFAYAAITAAMSLVPLFAHGGPVSERLAFSPDFDSEKLPPPVIRLPDGTQTPHNIKFDLQPNGGTQVLTIAMDATLDQVRNLRQTSANLTSTVATVTQQRDALAEKAAAQKPVSTSQTVVPALQSLQRSSAYLGAVQADFSRSLQVGDYARANALARGLRTGANSVGPAVAVIAKPAPPVVPH
jgi:hypothetical protein